MRLNNVTVGLQKLNYMKTMMMLAIGAAFLTSSLTAQVNLPAPSPTQTIQQDFGMGEVELTYSRPSLKGRPVFEVNSPIGPLDKPWRTGANAATKITFSDEVMVGDKTLKSGSYVIYTVPGKSGWKVVLSKGKVYPGQEGFTTDNDVVALIASPQKMAAKVETFTMQFANIMPESCDLQLMWSNTLVSFPIKTDIKTKLRKQVETALASDKKPYYDAATFYYQWEKNLPKALENINKAVEENKTAFWMFMLKARIQKDMGDVADAKATAYKVTELAKAAKNDDYVKQASDLFKKS